jgi:hypothetical protein
MARQRGIIKLVGTIGDISFYKSQDGFLAREKGGVDGKRIATDAAFQRTRENGSEFGRAGKSGKLIRTAFRNLVMNVSDNRLTSRLVAEMVKVLQADITSVRGQRNVIDGEADLLAGFDFNRKSNLSNSLFAPYIATIDRVTGDMGVVIPGYVPAEMIAAPGGTTHYKIVSAGAEIDFENETYVSDGASSVFLPWSNATTVPLTLTSTVTPASTHPLFLALGVEFYQEVNGVKYPLKNGAFNALALVKVEGM